MQAPSGQRPGAARNCDDSHSLAMPSAAQARQRGAGVLDSTLGNRAGDMTAADKRVDELLERWLASVDRHARYLSLDDAAYARAENWPRHQRPNALVVNLARTRLRELQAHLVERRDAGDARFAEALELMSFLTGLLGSEHLQRFIPLATGKPPDTGVSATVEQPRLRSAARAAGRAARRQDRHGRQDASCRQDGGGRYRAQGEHRHAPAPGRAPAPQQPNRLPGPTQSRAQPRVQSALPTAPRRSASRRPPQVGDRRTRRTGDRRRRAHARVGSRVAGGGRPDRAHGRSPGRGRDLEDPARASHGDPGEGTPQRRLTHGAGRGTVARAAVPSRLAPPIPRRRRALPMPSRRTSALALLVTSFAVAGAAQAQAAKPEQVLKYRKALYQVIGWNFGPMSAMAQGKVPYDAAEFARRAERVAAVAPMLGEAFPPESKGVANSEAEAGDVDQPRRLRRQDEGPGRAQRRTRHGGESRRLRARARPRSARPRRPARPATTSTRTIDAAR